MDSEVGTLQPIERLVKITKEHGALLHTDAVQVAGRLPIDVSAWSRSIVSLSQDLRYSSDVWSFICS